jgi:phosphatidate cytidylyltransferase
LSNLVQRVLVALVAIPVIIVLCMVGGIPFFLFITTASSVALYEYYTLARAKGARPMIGLGLAAGIAVNCTFFYVKLHSFLVGLFTRYGGSPPFPTQFQLLAMILMVSVVTLLLVELFRKEGSAILNLSTTLFGVLYISLFFGTFIGLRELFLPQDFPVVRFFPDAGSLADPAIIEKIYRWGGYTVISVFAIIWICDTAAFHFGKSMGRHKLFPRVSPNKSWEGAVAGFVFAVASALAAKFLVLEYLSVGSAVIIGIIVGTIGQLGDLAESLIKRDAGVKDSSALIPGHGGAFDRFDSLLLVAPLVYLYIDFILFS